VFVVGMILTIQVGSGHDSVSADTPMGMDGERRGTAIMAEENRDDRARGRLGVEHLRNLNSGSERAAHEGPRPDSSECHGGRWDSKNRP
jgi:hypothetical protein